MSRELAVAIVGCGAIGAVHADAVKASAAMTVRALVDVDGGRAAALADRIDSAGAPRPGCFGTLAEAIAGTEIDLVVVCTPSGLHIVVAREALAADKHVLLEKPLDVDLARGRELVALAREAEGRGIVTSVISQHRFDPASVVVKDAASTGRFGRLTSGLASVPWWRAQQYYDSGDWRGTWELDGGGALMNQGVHTLDLLLWIMGRPVEVMASIGLVAHENIEVEDVTSAIVRFESGALGVVHATTAAYPGLGIRLQVHGDRGSAVIESDRLTYFHAADPAADLAGPMGVRPGAGNTAQLELPGDTGAPSGHAAQYNDVYRAITTGSAVGVSADDALLALATIRAIYLSATLGRPVTLDEVLAGELDDVAVRV